MGDSSYKGPSAFDYIEKIKVKNLIGRKKIRLDANLFRVKNAMKKLSAQSIYFV